MNIPKELKYTKEHEWAQLNDQDNAQIVTVGITDHAQSSLGDVVFVELPAVGRMLKAGETFGVVESIKAVSDLYSPVTGRVTECNPAVTQEPGLINQDPYGRGWLIKVELTDPASLNDLMDAGTYAAYVASLS